MSKKNRSNKGMADALGDVAPINWGLGGAGGGKGLLADNVDAAPVNWGMAEQPFESKQSQKQKSSKKGQRLDQPSFGKLPSPEQFGSTMKAGAEKAALLWNKMHSPEAKAKTREVTTKVIDKMKSLVGGKKPPQEFTGYGTVEELYEKHGDHDGIKPVVERKKFLGIFGGKEAVELPRKKRDKTISNSNFLKWTGQPVTLGKKEKYEL